jgi:prepilin-type processing-associated H-X9-DG protein
MEGTFPEKLDKFAIVDMEHRVMEKIGILCPSIKKAYVYRAASLTVTDIPTLILVHDLKSNHSADKGRNVLFLDSHVEWVSEERFQELIKKDNEYRKEKGIPEIPAQ